MIERCNVAGRTYEIESASLCQKSDKVSSFLKGSMAMIEDETLRNEAMG